MINICYFSHDRQSYFDLLTKCLNGMKPENKKRITLSILASGAYDWDRFEMPEGVGIELVEFPQGNNYLQKVGWCLEREHEFCFKMDEDCFVPPMVLDYMVEQADVLRDPRCAILLPELSNGIPTVDYFIEDFVEDFDVKNDLYNAFRNQIMPCGLWGADYSPLNVHTIDSYGWNSSAFYGAVENLSTPLKGIHPIRISATSQSILNEYIYRNLDKLWNASGFSLQSMFHPYYTNSCFLIKRDIWAKALSMPHGMDVYDEIKLNAYIRYNGCHASLVRRGYALHPMYNTIGGNRNQWGIGFENGFEYEKGFVLTVNEWVANHDTLHRR